jgi:quinol monooxygenase YgiN
MSKPPLIDCSGPTPRLPHVVVVGKNHGTVVVCLCISGEESMFNRTTTTLILAASLLLLLATQRVSADALGGQFVIVVELEIDPSQLDAFKAAIKENGETAVRVEPGCWGFNAVFEKDNPTRLRLFEIYENVDAFKAHLETPHFKKYAEATKDMVKARKRIENLPITLNVKGK